MGDEAVKRCGPGLPIGEPSMVGSAISTNSRSRLFLWSSDAAGLNGPGCPTEGEVIEVVGVAPQRVAVAAAVSSRLNVGISLIGSVAGFVI